MQKNRQKKREELERSCNELCAAISNSKIHTLLNNIIAICDKGIDDAKSIIEVQNELKQIFHEASAKWDALKSKLNAKKHEELLREVEAIFHDYQSCAKDAETIVIALGLGNVEEVKRFLSNSNSQEIQDIVHTTSELYENDLQGFIKQIISLRFKDLDIPDYASQIRVLMNESCQDENALETQLLARIGNARAQNALGDYYYDQKQYKKAFSWYKKSAEQGFAQAQYNLAWCYEAGEGVKKNETKAFEWYQKSADQGFAKAQHNLGICYYNGIVCDPDKYKAFEWFQKSAEQGVAEDQYNLGFCYYNGEGCDPDKYKAYEWYKKSAEQGVAEAQCNLGSCYEKGIGCDQDDDKAFEWYKKSAEQGLANAQCHLGNCYYKGKGCEQNYNQAFHWFTSASQDMQDIDLYSMSIFMIGVMYYNGEIGFGDKFTAVKYFKIAARYGFALAQYQLGCCYENGIGVKEANLEEAKYWYREAAKQGDADAIESLKRLEKSE